MIVYCYLCGGKMVIDEPNGEAYITEADGRIGHEVCPPTMTEADKEIGREPYSFTEVI